MEKLEFELTIRNLKNKELLQKEIKKICLKNQTEFLPLFYRLIANGDLRLEVVDNSLLIGECQIENYLSSGFIIGEFQTYFYAGCKDMNSVDTIELEPLDFSIIGDKIIFDLELPNEWIPNSDVY